MNEKIPVLNQEQLARFEKEINRLGRNSKEMPLLSQEQMARVKEAMDKINKAGEELAIIMARVEEEKKPENKAKQRRLMENEFFTLMWR